MNSNLNDYTPSTELAELQRFHYVQARSFIDKYGANKQELLRLFDKKLAELVPEQVRKKEEYKEHLNSLYAAIDLAFTDYQAKQQDDTQWTKAGD